eukprot:15349467-Ditylum_brightwellii.AAC.1
MHAQTLSNLSHIRGYFCSHDTQRPRIKPIKYCRKKHRKQQTVKSHKADHYFLKTPKQPQYRLSSMTCNVRQKTSPDPNLDRPPDKSSHHLHLTSLLDSFLVSPSH